MYLSGTFLGYSSFMSPQLSPISSVFNKITVVGEGTFDKLHVISEELSLSSLLAIDITEELSWGTTTIMLAEFNNNLNAGNLNLAGSVQNWDIYRLADGDTTLVKVASVDGTDEAFIDYRVPPYKNYIYTVFGSTSTEISEPLTALPLYVDFFNFFLIDEDTNVVYIFDLDVSSGSYEIQQDVTIYNTYNQFPTISQGARKYATNTITAICGDVECDSTLTQPVSYIKDLKDFIMNGRAKIFKTRKGDVMRVYTNNFRYGVIEDAIQSQPMSISFDMIEVSEV